MPNKKSSGALLADADFSAEEIRELIDIFLAVEGPDVRSLKRQYAVVKPYFSPTVVGLDNIPDEPTLFIGNHSMFALDAMILLPTVYHETGRFLRPMADNIWFDRMPGRKAAAGGMVLAHPDVCGALMEAGHDLLVFPGGAAEANKPAEERYSLVWRERYGFVRLAAKHGYNITPFGMVGPDEGWDHLIEGQDILHSKLVKLLQKVGLVGDIRDDILPPIPRGVFNTLIPKPQHCYLAFGEPIDVPDRRGKKGLSERIQKSIRKQVASSIESLVSDMLAMRTGQREEDSALRRLLTR
ncbi:MAG: lysophospholipid acyltransferase family protein [Halioglobus sp.]|nr:lysophospholipid acyltransferase family protein [Halioglobus sp.]